MLKHRLLTAAILIPLVLLGILKLPALYFNLIAAALLGLASWEWTHLIHIRSQIGRFGYVCSVVILFLLLSFFQIAALIILILGAIMALVEFWLLTKLDQFKKVWSYSLAIKLAMGYLVLLPAWIGITSVQSYNPFLLIFCLIIIWATDTGAYFVGRVCGKRPLAPQISPKKTIEGLAGGLFTAIFITVIGLLILNLNFNQSVILFIAGLLTASASVVGDLFESMVKRQANVKDSGSILPGHGGVLDRLDSLTAAMPFFALAVILIH